MADMHEATCSSSLPSRPALESEEISVFLHNLLNSSTSTSTSTSSPPLISESLKQIPFSSPQQPRSLFSSSPNFKAIQEDHHRPCRSTSTLLPESDCRVKDGTSTSTTESSASMDSYALILSSSGSYFPSMAKDTGTLPSIGVGDCDAVKVSVKRRNHSAGENDLDDFESKIEEGLDGWEQPSKPAPSRTSKRSRAAEVHNLSEKRRRSRINEKMKALQNLIPNSNKTDKASMLDEAIEYLKQLQLQVQMLSMRNGLSIHPMYLPGILEPLQLPQVRMGFSEGNELQPHTDMGTVTLPVNQDPSTHTSFGLSNQGTSSHQPVVIPSVTNISNPDSTYCLDSVIRVHQGPFQLSTTSEEIYREEILPQQQLHISHSTNLSETKMKPMAASSLPFVTRTSVLDNTNCGESSQDTLLKDRDSNQILIQQLHNFQTGRSVAKEENERKTLDY